MYHLLRDRRQRWLLKLIVWLWAEIILNFVGIDDIADYSEFVFERHLIAHLG
ncbi:MAG: hypothetical protein ACLFV6_06775 [Spirulinaceae cyanobacterium]